MEMNELPYAEEISYWKTSKASPDDWLDKIRRMINEEGGRIESQMYVAQEEQAGYILMFNLDGNRYKVAWPVLKTKTNNGLSYARVQAVTLMYHDIKNRLLSAKILGYRSAFLPFLLVPGGKTVSESLPMMLGAGNEHE